MRRLLLVLAALAVILFLAAGVYGAWKNPEHAVLDAGARTGASGNFIALSRGTTHYEMAGPDSARLLVLVHGFSVPSYIWDSTFAGLTATGHRVLRYDLYGRGLSDRPDGVYDGALYDGQLGELLDSLRVSGPVDLAGVSFGGFVTAHFVGTHPARVHSLILVDPVASGDAVPGVLSVPVLGSWIWQSRVVPGMADNQLSDFLHPEHYPTWPDQYRPQMRYKGFGHALLSSRMTLSHTNFDSLYAGVARAGIPVLLIWGKQDQTVPFPLSEVVRRNIPSLQFFPVDSSGHLPHIEQAQQVNARLSTFLDAPH